jgi:SRSO17 transposase
MENDEGGGGRAGRLAAYLADLASVLGDARRFAAMVSYCTGLLLPSERKSVEPIAALTAPKRTAALHQSSLHFVGQGDWSDDAVMERIRAYTMPRMEAHGAISAWIVDDTGFPKKASTRSASHRNIADNWASRTIVRSQFHCRLPMITRV